MDFEDQIPIYQEIDFESEQVPFGLLKAKRENMKVSDGLKCEKIEIIPHAHVTHLESKSHLGVGGCESLPVYLNEPLLTKIIDVNRISDESADENVQFIILKKEEPKKRAFDGVKERILEQVMMKYPKIVVLGINEASFDPEEDNGALLAHKFLFTQKKEIYLIELLNLDKAPAGVYNCYLNLFRYGLTDAYPCSPVLYRIPAEMVLSDSCLFCKIIRGVIPSFKVYETNLTYAFLDINPLSEGHILVIPKFHGARLHEITDEHLADILPVARKILLKAFGDDGASVIPPYNILQNNGRLAHQEVEHVHFHIIPKRSEGEGLGIKWSATPGNMTKLAEYAETIRSKLAQ